MAGRTIVYSQAEADRVRKQAEERAYQQSILATRNEYNAQQAAIQRSITERIEGNIKKSGRKTTILAGENQG